MLFRGEAGKWSALFSWRVLDGQPIDLTEAAQTLSF